MPHYERCYMNPIQHLIAYIIGSIAAGAIVYLFYHMMLPAVVLGLLAGIYLEKMYADGVVSKRKKNLRLHKEVGGQAAHQLAGAVAVIEGKAHVLHVVEEVAADIGLHTDAEGVTPVAHHEVQGRTQHEDQHHRRHDNEERAVLLLRQPAVHGGAGDEGEGQIDDRHAQRAGHIQQKQLPMGAEIGQEDAHQRAIPVVFGGHRAAPLNE